MLWSDLRVAFRTLRKSPTFSVVAVLILAVGIGGIATAFSVVDAFLLSELPYRDADRLVHLYRSDPQTGSTELRFSLPLVDRLAAEAVFEDLGAYTYFGRNLSGGDGDPEHLTAATLTDNLLELLGATPALGRAFTSGDGHPGAAPVVILDWGLWQRRLGGATDAIGSIVQLDGVGHEIVGVMGPDFDFPYGEVKAWTPIARDSLPHDAWDDENYQPVGRLAPDATAGEARQAAELAYRRIESDRLGREVDFGVRVVPLRQALLFLYEQIRLVMLLVLIANGFVLLTICTNLAGLLVGRAVGRRRETAIRGVLGASRGRIVRQLLTEGALLAAAGGAVGLGLAAWQVELADTALPEALFRAAPLGIDGRVIAVTLGVAALTTLLFALLPALQASRGSLVTALKDGGLQAGSGRGLGWSRGGLVVVQVASAVVLLVGTGLMVRTVALMQRQDLGFATDGILTMGLRLPESDYPDAERLGDFQTRARERLLAVPGIAEAAFVEPLPLNFASYGLGFEIEGRPPGDGERLQAGAHWVGPGYFDAMRQALLRGRAFSVRDDAEAPRVVVVNRTFADRWWPAEDAVGRRIRAGANAEEWSTVVGVVADSKTFFATEEPKAIIFVPMSQRPARSPFLLVRTTGAPHASFPAVREALDGVDPNLPLSDVRSMAEVVDQSMLPWRGTTGGLVLLAGLALLLAVLGIFGVVSFASSSRIREIGVRRAMGARTRDVLRLVVGRSALLVLLGLGVGLALGIALSQLLSSLLFGVATHDPATYGGVSLLLLAAAAVAALVPAARALRVDPMRALRHD